MYPISEKARQNSWTFFAVSVSRVGGWVRSAYRDTLSVYDPVPRRLSVRFTEFPFPFRLPAPVLRSVAWVSPDVATAPARRRATVSTSARPSTPVRPRGARVSPLSQIKTRSVFTMSVKKRRHLGAVYRQGRGFLCVQTRRLAPRRVTELTDARNGHGLWDGRLCR